jgi:hypothetical protein
MVEKCQNLLSPTRIALHIIPLYSSLQHDTRARYLHEVNVNSILKLYTDTLPHVIIILDCHLDGNNLFNSRFDGASATIYGIYNHQPCPTHTFATTHIVHRRHKIILIRRHTQLFHNITRLPLIHNARIRHIVCVDVLEQKHNGAQRHEAQIDSAEERFFFGHGEERAGAHAVRIVAVDVGGGGFVDCEGASAGIVEGGAGV